MYVDKRKLVDPVGVVPEILKIFSKFFPPATGERPGGSWRKAGEIKNPLAEMTELLGDSPLYWLIA